MRNIENYAVDYENLPFEDKQVLFRRRAVIENICKYRHANILEIGCGTSPIFMHFDDYSTMTVVEPAAAFFKIAKKMAGNDPRVICKHALFEEIADSLSSTSYDLILISSLLHELKNPEIFLAEVKKVCTKDTVVHINVPNANSMHRILAKEMGLINDIYEMSQQNIQMQQHSVFSLPTLKEMLLESGFKVINEGSYFIKPFSHKQMEQCLKNGIFDDRLLEGLYRLEKYFNGYGSEIFINSVTKDE